MPKRACIWLVFIAFTATSCSDTVLIQRQYDKKRDKCRDAVEDLLGDPPGSDDADANREYNRSLAIFFADCMSSFGWTVASPNQGGGGGQ